MAILFNTIINTTFTKTYGFDVKWLFLTPLRERFYISKKKRSCYKQMLIVLMMNEGFIIKLKIYKEEKRHILMALKSGF